MRWVVVVGLLILITIASPITMGDSRAAGDLRIDRLVPSINTPLVGEKVTFWIYLSSTGEFWNVDVGVYIDFELEMVKTVPHIEDGDDVKIWFTWTFKEAGEHNVTVVVDYLNESAESNEENNIKSLDIEVKGRKLPDLVVSGIEKSKNVIYEDDEVTFNIMILSRNESAFSVPVNIYLDSELKWRKVLPAVPENRSYAIIISTTFSAGNHTLEVFVNPESSVDESNYNNNYAALGIRVYSIEEVINLRVSNVRASASEVNVGERMTVGGEIENTGNTDLTDIPVAITYDGDVIKVVHIPELAAGATYTLAYPLTTYTNRSGEVHQLGIFVDYGNLYRETDENDNYGVAEVIVNVVDNYITLTPGDIFLSMERPQEGVGVTIYSRIWNTGDSVASTEVEIKVDNTTIKSAQVSVKPGKYVLLYKVWECMRGWHRIGVHIELGNITVEKLIWVEPSQAKLEIKDFELSSYRVYVDQKIWLFAHVENSGTRSAVNTGVMFLWSNENDSGMIRIVNITILPKTTSIVKVSWTPDTEGDYNVSVAFLPSTDCSYVNYNMTSYVNVSLALPDIVIENATYEKIGKTAVIRVNITNDGVVAAQNFLIYVEDNGEVKNKTFISLLSKGSKVTLKFNITLDEGSNEVKVIADYGNSIKEYNETNNEATLSIYSEPDNTKLYITLAIIAVSSSGVVILTFVAYSFRRYIAGFFYRIISYFILLYRFLISKPPFSRIVEGFREWEEP